MQDDDLLAKDDILREEGGVGLEDRPKCSQHSLEDFDKHRGKMPTTSRAPEKSLVDSTSYRVFAADRCSRSLKHGG
jgi:hypothetical protein